MPVPFVIPQNSQQMLDARGIVTRPWYLFFQAVFDRIGGANGTGNAVIDQALEDIRVEMAMMETPPVVPVASDSGADDLLRRIMIGAI